MPEAAPENSNATHVPPEWIGRMAKSVAESIDSLDLMAPLGCHYFEADGFWEVTLFASLTEVVGGHLDGRLCASKFSVNVLKFCEVFSHVVALDWQAQAVDGNDELGTHISVEGIYDQNPISVRILAVPPGRFPPGRKAFSCEHAWQDLW